MAEQTIPFSTRSYEEWLKSGEEVPSGLLESYVLYFVDAHFPKLKAAADGLNAAKSERDLSEEDWRRVINENLPEIAETENERIRWGIKFLRFMRSRESIQ